MRASCCLMLCLLCSFFAAPRHQSFVVPFTQRPFTTFVSYKPSTNYVTHSYVTNTYESNQVIGTQLKQKDFNATYVITKPGLYWLGESINFSSATSFYVLVIACDDVIIDFNSCALLWQARPDLLATHTCDAICVPNGRHNVCIKNGSIRNFNGRAVTICGDDARPVTNVCIDHMILTESKKGVDGHDIQNIAILDSSINHNTSGLALTNVEDVIVERCNIQLNKEDSACAGLELVHVANAKISDNRVDSNISLGDCYGICVQDGSSVTLERNWVAHNQTELHAQRNAGIALINCAHCMVSSNNCINHKSTNASAGILLIESIACNVSGNTLQYNSIGIDDKSVVSANVYIGNTSIGDTQSFLVVYREGKLPIVKAYPPALDVLGEANKYANIQIIV